MRTLYRAALLAALLAAAPPAAARATEPDQDRDRRARAALALAGAAAPKVATAPAPRPAPKPYPVAYERAAKEGLPLVVFVGCRAEHERPPGSVLARADSLPGVDGPAALVLYPAGGRLYRHAVIPCPVEEAALKAAVESARRKIDAPKVSDAAAPKPLEWDIRADDFPATATNNPGQSDRTRTDPRAAIARVRVDRGDGYDQGSGTVVRSGEGWSLVLTADHVVRSPGELTVRCDGRTVRAQVVARDRDADLAVLLVPGDFPAVRVAGGEVEDGTAVVVYGLTSVLTRGTVTDRMTLNGHENLTYGTREDSDSGDSGAGVFAGGELVGVHLGKSGTDARTARPRAAGPGPVRAFLRKVLADDGSLRAKPVEPNHNKPAAIYPDTPKGKRADAPGTLRTASGRVLIPLGNGSYRYADEGPPAALPAAPACPNGRCPLPR